MKNFWIRFLLILFLSFSNLCCYCKQSLNTFTINIQDVPRSTASKNDDGLSDGAITAIALGSTFGGLGILSGIGYYFYKNSKGLQTGCVCGQKCPYQMINCKDFLEIIHSKKQYTYLKKASEKAELNSDYYYLVIPDTEIKTKTFNTFFFELPKTNYSEVNFRIIQASKPYRVAKNIPDLDSNIFINPKDDDAKKIPSYAKELKSNEGYLIKSGSFVNPSHNVISLCTENLSSKENQIYAIIVEVWRK